MNDENNDENNEGIWVVRVWRDDDGDDDHADEGDRSGVRARITFNIGSPGALNQQRTRVVISIEQIEQSLREFLIHLTPRSTQLRTTDRSQRG